MPVDLTQLAQGIGVPWSVVGAIVTAAITVFLVCLVAVIIDACYLSVAARRDHNDPRNVF